MTDWKKEEKKDKKELTRGEWKRLNGSIVLPSYSPVPRPLPLKKETLSNYRAIIRDWIFVVVSRSIWTWVVKTTVDFFTDTCTTIKTVSSPITHNTLSPTQGAWMKDPLGVMGNDTIFVLKSHHSNTVEEFENMEKFKAGVKSKTYTLPYYQDGTGAVMYGSYLYYNRYRIN